MKKVWGKTLSLLLISLFMSVSLLHADRRSDLNAARQELRLAQVERNKARSRYATVNRNRNYDALYREAENLIRSALRNLNRDPRTARREAASAKVKFIEYVAAVRANPGSGNNRPSTPNTGNNSNSGTPQNNARNKINEAQTLQREVHRIRNRYNRYRNIRQMGDNALRNAANFYRRRNYYRALNQARYAVMKFNEYKRRLGR